MATPDMSKFEAMTGKVDFTLYAISILGKGEKFSWDGLEKRFLKVDFKADDATQAANAIADEMQAMMGRKKEEDAAAWFPMKLFQGDKECTHVLSDILFDRKIITITPVSASK